VSRSQGGHWQASLESATGARVVSATRLAGGDIGDSFRVRLGSGEALFVKHYRDAPGDLAAREASGLEWLSAAGAPIRVARALAHGCDWLALEWIESSVPAPGYDDALGEGLAQLHSASPGAFGLTEDNWIGRLPQTNSPLADGDDCWARFYATRRIEPMRQRASHEGLLPAPLEHALGRLIERMPDLVGVEEPAARLHGDLWAGNVLPDERGLPCLIDPACYGGHREIDLAMMRLFGGFSDRVFQAYESITPLSPGATERIPLYQVHPLLVHVCLFGAGYVARLARAVEQALSVHSRG